MTVAALVLPVWPEPEEGLFCLSVLPLDLRAVVETAKWRRGCYWVKCFLNMGIKK
jgi:hypothetical protein